MRKDMMDGGAMFDALPKEHALDIVGWFERALQDLVDRRLDQDAVVAEFFES